MQTTALEEIRRRGRRNAPEIIYHLLLTSKRNGPVSKTKMMGESFMNFKQTTKYLDYAVEQGLMIIEDRKYANTNRGMDYIKLYESIESDTKIIRQNAAMLSEFLPKYKMSIEVKVNK